MLRHLFVVRLLALAGLVLAALIPLSPVAATHQGLRVTVSCYSNPEITRIKNITDSPLIIDSIRSLVRPLSSEPFSVNRTLLPGQAMAFQSGPAATRNVLTRQYIYNDPAGSREGAQVWIRFDSGSEIVFIIEEQRCAAPTSTPPAAPSNLRAIVLDANRIKLTWTDNSSNGTNFQVYNGSTPGSRLGANVTSYIWGGPEPGSYNCLTVFALNGAGSSRFPGWACATTPS